MKKLVVPTSRNIILIFRYFSIPEKSSIFIPCHLYQELLYIELSHRKSNNDFLSFCFLFCVCLCVVTVYMCVPILKGQRRTSALHLMPQTQSPLQNLELVWLPEPQQLSCLCSSQHWCLWHGHPWLFMWLLRFELRFSCLCTASVLSTKPSFSTTIRLFSEEIVIILLGFTFY